MVMDGKMLCHGIRDDVHEGCCADKLRRAVGQGQGCDDAQDNGLRPPLGRSGPRPLPTCRGG